MYSWIRRRNASIAGEDVEMKYKALPLHKAVVTGTEMTLEMVQKSKETIRHLVDLSKRPAYQISHEVFLFIVKELLLVKGQIIGKQKTFPRARALTITPFLLCFLCFLCVFHREFRFLLYRMESFDSIG